MNTNVESKAASMLRLRYPRASRSCWRRSAAFTPLHLHLAQSACHSSAPLARHAEAAWRPRSQPDPQLRDAPAVSRHPP